MASTWELAIPDCLQVTPGGRSHCQFTGGASCALLATMAPGFQHGERLLSTERLRACFWVSPAQPCLHLLALVPSSGSTSGLLKIHHLMTESEPLVKV